jgi:hypothetical protein
MPSRRPAIRWRARLRRFALPFACIFLQAVGWRAFAHDIPNELRVHMHVTQDGDRLQVLARLPLSLLLNLDLPKQGPGYLDLARIEPGLARAIAATVDRAEALWAADRTLADAFTPLTILLAVAAAAALAALAWSFSSRPRRAHGLPAAER